MKNIGNGHTVFSGSENIIDFNNFYFICQQKILWSVEYLKETQSEDRMSRTSYVRNLNVINERIKCQPSQHHAITSYILRNIF